MLRPHLIIMLVSSMFGASVPSGSSNIRLINGNNICSGRVEVYHDGQWGTVCDDGWDMNDAEVVCKQLGCGRAVRAHGSAHFGQGSGLILLDEVACSGSENALSNCSHKGLDSHYCFHFEDAGVTCSGGLNIRLVNGAGVCSGRVEVYHDGQWGTVCDDNWDMNDAEVVCRELGCGTALSTPNRVYFGQGSGPVLLDDVACSGSESSITACHHEGFGKHNCNHDKDAGVICSVDLLQPTISFRSPDGWFYWGPQGPEVTKGHSFFIICSTQPQYPGGYFHLEFSGSNITRTQSAVNHSATFSFPEADYVHRGNYSCVYEVAVSSRTFRSPTTELLEVTVKASPAPFIGFGVAAGLLLILVPIIIFFIKRFRKQEDQTAVKTDHRCHAKNTNRVTRWKDEMDDDDYDNVYDNAGTGFQREVSDHSDEDCINVENNTEHTAAGNDYTGAKSSYTNDVMDIYENTGVFVYQRGNLDVSDKDHIKVAADI